MHGSARHSIHGLHVKHLSIVNLEGVSRQVSTMHIHFFLHTNGPWNPNIDCCISTPLPTSCITTKAANDLLYAQGWHPSTWTHNWKEIFYFTIYASALHDARMPFQKRVNSQEQSFLSGSKLPSLAQLNFFWGACHTGQELKPKTLTTLVKTQSQFMVQITTLPIKDATSNAKPKMGFVSGSPSF